LNSTTAFYSVIRTLHSTPSAAGAGQSHHTPAPSARPGPVKPAAMADTGLGLRAAAARFKLDVIPW
jgi:hypothetical protein